MSLPTDAAARKSIPVYSGFMNYFPLAIAEVAVLSKIGNDQHNPGKPLHWDRSKSGDELDALSRHLLEAGTIDTDGVRHSAKLAWRAMANLEKELEKAAKAEREELKRLRFNDYVDAYTKSLRAQIDLSMVNQYSVSNYGFSKQAIRPTVPTKYEGNPFSVIANPCSYT